uniref:basic proline-rich protein-like n=1 Tax=Odobenus rosmarus divergens TaxID=9708 RepID=UPI00063CAE9D|nr:PREDICTED: basic proline-rich protein-like [Odobenus rosmarus divergens]
MVANSICFKVGRQPPQGSSPAPGPSRHTAFPNDGKGHGHSGKWTQVDAGWGCCHDVWVRALNLLSLSSSYSVRFPGLIREGARSPTLGRTGSARTRPPTGPPAQDPSAGSTPTLLQTAAGRRRRRRHGQEQTFPPPLLPAWSLNPAGNGPISGRWAAGRSLPGRGPALTPPASDFSEPPCPTCEVGTAPAPSPRFRARGEATRTRTPRSPGAGAPAAARHAAEASSAPQGAHLRPPAEVTAARAEARAGPAGTTRERGRAGHPRSRRSRPAPTHLPSGRRPPARRPEVRPRPAPARPRALPGRSGRRRTAGSLRGAARGWAAASFAPPGAVPGSRGPPPRSRPLAVDAIN